MVFKDEYLKKSVTFQIDPGNGLYVPSTAPHFVRNGPDVSVSFSITFRTHDLETKSLAHVANRRMRSLGLRPAPVGQSPARDVMKIMIYRIWRKSLTLARMVGLASSPK